MMLNIKQNQTQDRSKGSRRRRL